jgi:hypothetical protein
MIKFVVGVVSLFLVLDKAAAARKRPASRAGNELFWQHCSSCHGMARLVLGLTILLALAVPARAQFPLTCFLSGGGLPLLRAEGSTELTGDLIVSCFGGAPTAQGDPVLTANIQVFLNTSVTSRLLSGVWSEALLLIDEPAPAAQRVCGTAGDVLAGTGVCAITGTGTGLGVYDGSLGRPNVFQGQQAGVNSIVWTGVPIDPPGFGLRVIRIVNLRANAAQLGTSAPNQLPTTVVSTVSSTGAGRLPIGNNAQWIVGFVFPGLATSVEMPTQCARLAANISGITGKRVSQTMVHLLEQGTADFKPRTIAAFIDANTSPPAADQNVPGSINFSETGFFNSTFPELDGRGNLSQAGLADQGTRVFVRLDQVPPGIALYAPVVVPVNPLFFGNPGVARMTDTDGEGAGPFVPIPAGAGGLARIGLANGTATVFYEVLSAASFLTEQVDIPIYAASDDNSGVAALARSSLFGGFAPVSAESGASLTAPMPRFAQTSTSGVRLIPRDCQQ